MVQCLNVFSLFKRIESLFNGSNRLKMTFHSIKTYLAKRIKTNLTKHFIHKELHRFDFLIAIKEYVGARETPSSTAKR